MNEWKFIKQQQHSNSATYPGRNNIIHYW